MSSFKSILISGSILISAGMLAASAGTVNHYEGDIPYETVKFLNPYTAFFKGDITGVLDCKTAKSSKFEENKEPKTEVKFPEKPDAEDLKPAGKETLGVYYIPPVMTSSCTFKD